MHGIYFTPGAFTFCRSMSTSRFDLPDRKFGNAPHVEVCREWRFAGFMVANCWVPLARNILLAEYGPFPLGHAR